MRKAGGVERDRYPEAPGRKKEKRHHMMPDFDVALDGKIYLSSHRREHLTET